MINNSLSSDTEDSHREININLPQLPYPPQDLPKPWDYRAWQRWVQVGFFITLFGLWFLGRLFDIEFLDLGGSCIFKLGDFSFLLESIC